MYDLMSVDQLCKNYLPLYPEGNSWDKTVQYMLNNSTEREIVLDLIEELSIDGKFREHVTVGLSAADEPVVLNGTHRVVASILVNHSQLRVFHYNYDEREDDSSEKDTSKVIKVELNFQSTILHKVSYNSLSDSLFDHLRSLKLSKEIWLTSDFSTGNGLYHNFFYCTNKIDDTIIELLSNKVQAVLQKIGIMSYVDVITIQEEPE